MTDQEFNDELLSAYLDGELSDVEVSLVERRLAEDADARQLLAELRALSGSLKSLPRAPAEPGVRAEVLRRVEARRELPPADAIHPMRRLLWPLVALAALLLLMFTQGDRVDHDRDVALVREPADTPAEASRPVEDLAEGESPALETERPAVGELRPMAEEVGEERFGGAGARVDALSSGEATGGAAGEELAASATRDADAPAAPAMETFGGGRLSRSGMSALRTAELDGEVGVVHLTVTNMRDGNDRFNSFLAGNGVLVFDEEDVPQEAGVMPDERLDSSANRRSVDRVVTNPPAAAGEPQAAAPAQLEGRSKQEQPSSGPEMVLVEAPLRQIAQILMDCNEDSEAIEEVVIDEATTAEVSPAAVEQMNQFRGYQKVSPQRASKRAYAVTPAQRGVVEVLNSLSPAANRGQAQAENSPQTTDNRAWAARLPKDQPPLEYQQYFQRAQVPASALSKGRQRQLANESVDKLKTAELYDAAKPSDDTDQQMRVLFFLHPRGDE